MQRANRPDTPDVALGRRLKSLRIRRGLSQTALGEVLGVSFQQIQKYERGAHRIRVSQLGRLAEALGVSAAEFLEIPRTESSEIADMIDTRVAWRLMNAFQSLTPRASGAVSRRWSRRWQRVDRHPTILAAPSKCLALTTKSLVGRGATNQPYQPTRGKESMLLRLRRSLAATVAQRSAGSRWQAVAFEVSEGVAKAVLLIGSMAAGIVLSLVLAAMSLQP
jgi:transcriptional regulator with XRE-family HTH domain